MSSLGFQREAVRKRQHGFASKPQIKPNTVKPNVLPSHPAQTVLTVPTVPTVPTVSEPVIRIGSNASNASNVSNVYAKPSDPATEFLLNKHKQLLQRKEELLQQLNMSSEESVSVRTSNSSESERKIEEQRQQQQHASLQQVRNLETKLSQLEIDLQHLLLKQNKQQQQHKKEESEWIITLYAEVVHPSVDLYFDKELTQQVPDKQLKQHDIVLLILPMHHTETNFVCSTIRVVDAIGNVQHFWVPLYSEDRQIAYIGNFSTVPIWKRC